MANWTTADLDRAIALVREEGKSAYAASRATGVPKTTLLRRLQKLDQPDRSDGPPERSGPQDRRDRDPNGRFLPGVSGNPGGRRMERREAIRRAEEAALEAVETAIEIMRDSDASRNARLQAIREILDRALGKPKQAVSMDLDMTETHQYHITQEIITRQPDLLDTIFLAPAPRQEVTLR